MKTLDNLCCFAAGTLVDTDKGLRAIETIKVGDLVLSRSDVTGQTAYKPVDLPPNFHPAAIRVPTVDTPFGAG
ncbi:MAG: Hint domain-containing protein [Alphaproteobacteria bacterium]|nr:Hint domain-containing protein [Alphaproteobacteria bacterium]